MSIFIFYFTFVTLQATSGPELEKTNGLIDSNYFKKNLSNGNIPETLNERILVASEGNCQNIIQNLNYIFCLIKN